MSTYELRNVTTILSDPQHSLMVGVGRSLNVKLAAIEALQLVGGFSDPTRMQSLSPATRPYMDGGTFHGAYGPRLRAQIPRVITRLDESPQTRRAVATIWDPSWDLFHDDANDYPCTVYLSWHLRRYHLHMTTHMRSNDLHMGWPYDSFQFTTLHASMANALNVEQGEYTHVVDSLHLYDKDVEAAMRVNSDFVTRIDYPIVPNNGLGADIRRQLTTPPRMRWTMIMNRAHELTYNPKLMKVVVPDFDGLLSEWVNP